MSSSLLRRCVLVLAGLLGLAAGAVALVEAGTGTPVRKIAALFARMAWHQSPRELYQVGVFAHLLHQDVARRQFNPRTGIRDIALGLEACRRDPDCGAAELGRLLWEHGRFGESASVLESHLEADPGDLRATQWLALSYLRLAEERNCLPPLTEPPTSGAEATAAVGAGHPFRLQRNPHPAPHHYMCALPGGEAYSSEDDALRAAAALRSILEEFEAHPVRAWWRSFTTEVNVDTARYLLFVACLRIGRERDESCLPERLRIPTDTLFYRAYFGDIAERTRAELGQLVLRDASKQVGLNLPNDAGRGVVVEDFDLDGDLEILWCGGFESCQLRSFEDGAFVDVTEAWGLAGLTGIHMATGADADGDGYVDLLLSRPWGGGPRGDFVLLHNEDGRRFRPITVEAGLLPPEESRGDESIMPWISAWGDVDRDGDLDLLMGAFGLYGPEGKTDAAGRVDTSYAAALRDNFQTKLYRNLVQEEGELRFADVTDQWFPRRWAWDGDVSPVHQQNVWAADFGDYDADGDVDLVVSRQYIPALLLLRNEGDHFERTELIESKVVKFMVRFIDIDHDGRLDVYASGVSFARSAMAQAVFETHLDDHDGRSTLFIQQEDGSFARRDDLLVNALPFSVMGVNFGDLNNDGAYELYQGTGNPQGEYIFPNLLYVGQLDAEGNPDGSLRNASMLQGVGNVQKGHGVVFLDPLGRGRQDLLSNLGGMWGGDRWPSQYFRNESRVEGAWTQIRLRGTRANRSGVGSILRIVARNARGVERVRYVTIGNGTGFGSQPYRAHVGLYDAESIEEVWVDWLGPRTSRRLYCGAELGALNVLLEEDFAGAPPGALRPSAVESCGG